MTTASDMPLVDYSSSENSESSGAEETGIQSNSHQRLKRKRDTSPQSHLPPLPDTFHDLYASTARVSEQDDPSLHGGRQRVTPHVEGNWPTHIYIECKFFSPLAIRYHFVNFASQLTALRVSIDRTLQLYQ